MISFSKKFLDNQKVLLSLPKNNKYETFLFYFFFCFGLVFLFVFCLWLFLCLLWQWLSFSRWCLIVFLFILHNTHSFEKKKKKRKKLFNNNSAIDSPAIDRQASSREKIKVILVCANPTVCDVAFRYSNL